MALPVAAVFFGLKAVMGADYEPVSAGELVSSIAFVTLALMTYELGERVANRIKDTERRRTAATVANHAVCLWVSFATAVVGIA